MGSRVIAYFGPATGERCMEQHPCKDPGLPGQALQLGPHPSIAPRRGSRGSRTRLPEGVHGIIHLREQNGSLLLLLLKALLGHQSCPILVCSEGVLFCLLVLAVASCTTLASRISPHSVSLALFLHSTLSGDMHEPLLDVLAVPVPPVRP